MSSLVLLFVWLAAMAIVGAIVLVILDRSHLL